MIYVTTHIDEIKADGKCSLREAIIAANENRAFNGCPAGGPGTDTIVIPKNQNSNTYYKLTLGTGDDTARKGDLDILDSVIITGAGVGQTTVAASGNDRAFHLVNLGSKLVRIQNMTITKGGNVTHGGAIFNEGSRLELTDVLIIDNQTSLDPSADTAGGGVSSIISKYAPSLQIINSSIRDNTSRQGGGVFSEGTLWIERSLVAGNRATIVGGGIDNNAQPGYSGITINSTITVNTSPDGAARHRSRSGSFWLDVLK